MDAFEINQIFEGMYPPEAALWCSGHRARMEELAPVTRQQERQELVREEVVIDEERDENGEVVRPAEVVPAEYRTVVEEVTVRRFQIVAIPEPSEEERIAALKADYESAVEGWLAEFAATRGYKVSNMGAYANSTNPTFRAEALYYIELQDRTWETCYAILNAVLAGERPVPTREQLFAELPVSTALWPVENPEAEQAARM